MGSSVMRRPPPYSNGFIDRHGKARWYFRRAGFKKVPPPALVPEFMAAYEQALAGQPAPIGAERTIPGTSRPGRLLLRQPGLPNDTTEHAIPLIGSVPSTATSASPSYSQSR
jgi:hypothetical protein